MPPPALTLALHRLLATPLFRTVSAWPSALLFAELLPGLNPPHLHSGPSLATATLAPLPAPVPSPSPVLVTFPNVAGTFVLGSHLLLRRTGPWPSCFHCRHTSSPQPLSPPWLCALLPLPESVACLTLSHEPALISPIISGLGKPQINLRREKSGSQVLASRVVTSHQKLKEATSGRLNYKLCR